MPTIIGFDPGAGAIKARAPEKSITLISQVAADSGRRLADESKQLIRKRPLQVRFNAAGHPVSFYVGAGAHMLGEPVENLDFNRLTGSIEMRALLYGALAKLLTPEQAAAEPLTLFVGLPVKFMLDDADANKARVKAWLRGRHEWTANGKQYTVMITEALVTNQPLGAVMEYLLGDDGLTRNDVAQDEELGVVSIGMSTTEMLVLKNMELVSRFTAGEPLGVSNLLAQADPDRLYSLAEMDERLRSGALQLNGQVDVFASRVIGLITKVWGGSARRFGQVIIGGGGSIVLRESLLRRFGVKMYIPDDPITSTATGLYRMGVAYSLE